MVRFLGAVCVSSPLVVWLLGVGLCVLSLCGKAPARSFSVSSPPGVLPQAERTRRSIAGSSYHRRKGHTNLMPGVLSQAEWGFRVNWMGLLAEYGVYRLWVFRL